MAELRKCPLSQLLTRELKATTKTIKSLTELRIQGFQAQRYDAENGIGCFSFYRSKFTLARAGATRYYPPRALPPDPPARGSRDGELSGSPFVEQVLRGIAQ